MRRLIAILLAGILPSRFSGGVCSLIPGQKL